MEDYRILITLVQLIIFFLPACLILSNKKRGAGYYVLAFFFPLIGLIVALCLKRLDPNEENSTPTSFDITDNQK